MTYSRNEKYKEADFTKEWLKDLYSNTTHCKYCGVTFGSFPSIRTIDHIIPLSREGKHIKSNLQIICWKCNVEKRNYLEEQFLARRRPEISMSITV